jgi:hypothetical protein
MNRRDAFRTAIAAAVTAMMPKPTFPSSEFAKIFGVQPEMIPPVPILYQHADCMRFNTSEFRRCYAEIEQRFAVALAEKIDRDWGRL